MSRQMTEKQLEAFRLQIQKTYQIDLDEENLLKTYGLKKTPDLSTDEVEKKIHARHVKWNRIVQGDRGPAVERCKQHLARAPAAEALLLDATIRATLFVYYAQTANRTARAFFSLIATSKQLGIRDVDFYFDYYEDRKHERAAVSAMLEQEFNLKTTRGRKNAQGLDSEEPDTTEKKKASKGQSTTPEVDRIVNNFEKQTILSIQKCEKNLAAARKRPLVVQQTPEVKDSLYQLLHLDRCQDPALWRQYLQTSGARIFELRNQYTDDYKELQDLFNEAEKLSKQRDVNCNFQQFRLIVQYHQLNPYMYELVAPKEETLNLLGAEAQKYYAQFFCDRQDFLAQYFIPVYPHFGIVDTKIKKVLRSVQGQMNASRPIQLLNRLLGIQENRNLPPIVHLLYFLTYWPLFLIYLLTELLRQAAMQLKLLAIPAGLLVALGAGGLIGFTPGDWLALFNPAEWIRFLTTGNLLEHLIILPGGLALLCVLIVLPALLVALPIWRCGPELYKMFDWRGFQRTMQEAINHLGMQTVRAYQSGLVGYLCYQLPRLMVNLGSLAALFLVLQSFL